VRLGGGDRPARRGGGAGRCAAVVISGVAGGPTHTPQGLIGQGNVWRVGL